ncbi:hypothetical protein E2C01_037825 [Portunus trituberculatus]|uniref:Uncharacterized protein n=1 Tax=Portunus trituberculatus TaxID=210409 RepID=A0A5B7FAD0_PORTR|nr:hypothetical protein [Portunus trituberculatus]
MLTKFPNLSNLVPKSEHHPNETRGSEMHLQAMADSDSPGLRLTWVLFSQYLQGQYRSLESPLGEWQ